MATTKTDVRNAFTYARQLMSEANKMLKNKSVTSFDNDSDFGQLCNDLVASVSTLQMWLDEQQSVVCTCNDLVASVSKLHNVCN